MSVSQGSPRGAPRRTKGLKAPFRERSPGHTGHAAVTYTNGRTAKTSRNLATFQTARAQSLTPAGSGSTPAPSPQRGARELPLPSAPCRAGPGVTGREHPGPAASPSPRRHPHPHPHPHPAPGSPTRASSLSLRGGTLASYSTRALVGSGSKHRTFSPEWNLNFMPSLALICSSWRRARLRGGRSARGGGQGGAGRWCTAAGGGREGAGNGGGCGRPALGPASARPESPLDLEIAGRSLCPHPRPPSASPRESSPGPGRLRSGKAGRGPGLPAEQPLPPSWERQLTRAAPTMSSRRARAVAGVWEVPGRQRPGVEPAWGGRPAAALQALAPPRPPPLRSCASPRLAPGGGPGARVGSRWAVAWGREGGGVAKGGEGVNQAPRPTWAGPSRWQAWGPQ